MTTATVTTGFTLQAFTSYYFVLQGGTTLNIEWSYTSSTDYVAGFGVSIPSARSSFYQSGGMTTYYSLSNGPQEFQVNGIALAAVVPEPAAWAWIAFGAAGASMVAMRGRRVHA